MFKIESYITPILLSYIEKYVENFKSEDSQVSLWSGGVSLYNLHLRTDIIQREFNLPFRFVSGYIYELLIQVPWMKIISDPIVVTINTIECILTLDKYPESQTSLVPTPEKEEDEPPGYMQSLIKKIVGNIAVRCNNLILKYIEGDIVVSLNIRHLSLDSTNSSWEPTFTEVTESDLCLRKLIQLNDLTFCVDESNAAGKIETYQEPLLFRCELIFRVLNKYHSVNSKRPYCTRLSICASCLDFNVSSQQIPILLRLCALIMALQKNELKIEKRKSNIVSTSSPETSVEAASDNFENLTSWSGWLWSFVPALPSSYALDDDSDILKNKFLMILCDIYIEKLSFVFKVPQYTTDVMHFHGSHKKNRALTMCSLSLTSVRCEISLPGHGNICARLGLGNILLDGGSSCTCGISDSLNPEYYISSKINLENLELTKSLAWPEVGLDDFKDITQMSAIDMLCICPAFAVEIISSFTEDFENESKEYLEGDKLIQAVLGPLHIIVCPSFIHRIQYAIDAIEKYDYTPYFEPLPDLDFPELPPPTTDEYDSLIASVPFTKGSVSASKLEITLNVWDHYDEKRTISLSSKKSSQKNFDESSGAKYIPSFSMEYEFIEAHFQAPTYPRLLVHTTCQLPEPPEQLINACYYRIDSNIKNVQCFLIFSSRERVPLSQILISRKSEESVCINNEANITKDKLNNSLPTVRLALTTQFSINCQCNNIIERKLWTKQSRLSYSDIDVTANNLSICGTAPRLLNAMNVLLNVLPKNPESSRSKSPFSTSSLINDCLSDKNMVHLDASFEEIRSTIVSELNVTKFNLNLQGCKIFAWDPVKRNNVEQVWILSAPESEKSEKCEAFMQIAIQLAEKKYDCVSYFCLKSEPFSFNVDPLLWQFLTYNPVMLDLKDLSTNISNNTKITTQKKSTDETGKPFSGRGLGQKSHSVGSDKEKDYVHVTPAQQNPIYPAMEVRSMEIENTWKNSWLQEYLKYNFGDLKHIQIMCDIAEGMVYFPLGPVTALDCQNLYDSMNKYVLNQKKNKLNLLYLGLPKINIQSISLKPDIVRTFARLSFITRLNEPVSDASSYPWSISITNLTCYFKSILKKEEFKTVPLLKPFNFNATIDITPKILKRRIVVPGAIASTKATFNLQKTEEESAKILKKNKNNATAESEIKIEGQEFEEELTSLAVYIHVDTGPIHFSFNQNQIEFIAFLVHGLQDLKSHLPHRNKAILTRDLNYDSSSNTKISDVTESKALSDPFVLSTPVTLIRPEEATCSSASGSISETQNETLAEKDTGGMSKSYESFDLEQLFTVSSWIQWTIPKITIVFYTDMINESKRDTTKAMYKLQCTAEDIVMSLDIDREYLKLKSKIVTADILYFRRLTNNEPWLPGQFHGLIIRGREKDSSRDENNFLSVTFTKAKFASLQSRWLDNVKKSSHIKKIDPSNKTYVSEVVISLQPLDILLNTFVFEIFASTISPFSSSIPCHSRIAESKIISDHASLNSVLMDNSPSIFSADTWNSQLFPLVYVESSDIKIIIPNPDLEECPDVLIFEIGSIKLTPHADNPINRQPLRPDLYQKATRSGLTDIPGSDLEDRQYQISLKNISVWSTMWFDLNETFEVKNTNFNDNPAFVWNNWNENNSSFCSSMIICEEVELSIVLALAMSYRNELVCGPALEFNIASDINILLSSSQFLLFHYLTRNMKELGIKFTKNALESQNRATSSACPYSSYISNLSRMTPPPQAGHSFEIFTTDYANNSNIDKPSDYSSTAYQSGTMTMDSGVGSDHVSATKSVSEFSRTTSKLYRKSPRLPPIHFDVYFVAGKIMINIFHQSSSKGYALTGKSKSTNINQKKHSITKEHVVTNRDFHHINMMPSHDVPSTSQQLQTPSELIPYRPLIYIELTQPNIFVSKHNFQSKLQISLFDAFLGLGDSKFLIDIPQRADYSLTLFESKKGIVNKTTGIPPALLTVKWIRCVGKSDILNIDIDRPINFILSITYMDIIKSAVALVNSNLDTTISTSIKIDNNVDVYAKENIQKSEIKSSQSSSLLWKIKAIMSEFHTINLKCSQVLLTCYPSRSSDIELKLSVASIQNSLINSLRPECISQSMLVESTMITFKKEKDSCIIMRPWTFGLHLNLSWETWQYTDSVENPIIRLMGEADKLILEIGPEQILAIRSLLQEWNEFDLNVKTAETWNSEYLMEDNILDIPSVSFKGDNSSMSSQPFILQEQHYKDDLRAGAFQFVEDSALPHAYQVSVTADRLCWRYPQPRAITRIHSFPVPFEVDTLKDAKQVLSVPCVLEYYSEVTETFQHLANFELKEEHHAKLDLNVIPPNIIFATLWSVRMIDTKTKCHCEKPEYFDRNKYLTKISQSNTKSNTGVTPEESRRFPVKSSMLAACLRVDSYFEPKLVPKFQLGFEFNTIEVNLFTPKINRLCSPPHAHNFKPHGCVTGSNIFLTTSLELSQIQFQKFDVNALLLGIQSNLRIDMLDSRYFRMHPMLKRCPFQVSIALKMPLLNRTNLKYDQPVDVDLRVGELLLDVSPSIIHNTLNSLMSWTNYVFQDTSSDDFLWSMKKKYLICNDSAQTLLLSQKESVENVILESRCCIPYSWFDRSLPKCLHVGNEDGDWQLSKIEGINLDTIGTTQYNLDPSIYGLEAVVVVTVEQINTGQNKITIMGRLIVWNMLSEDIHLKIMYDNDERTGRISRAVTLKQNFRAPSILIPYSCDKLMRLKFTNIDSGITGEIPVKSPKENVPWLVKIPMQNNKNDFVSIWCRVICDKETKRIFISLWPLYIIKSHLPLWKEVNILTMDFDHSITAILPGKGSHTAILYPGTTVTKHNMIFNNREATNVNGVTFHYGMVDQMKFFSECNIKSDMEVILSTYNEWLNKTKSAWPYSCVQSLSEGTWQAADEQPNTHITVHFESAGPHISSLIVDVSPWGMVVNASCLLISFNFPNGQEICSVRPGTVAMTTPKFIEETFVLSIADEEGSIHISDFITVKNVEIGLYEVKKPGILNVENHCETRIVFRNMVSHLTLYYEIKENINVFGVSCKYLMMNHLEFEVLAAFVIVPSSTGNTNEFPVIPSYFISIAPEQNKNQKATPVPYLFCHYLDSLSNCDDLKSFALYVAISLDNMVSISCPVRIDKFAHRRGITVKYKNKSVPIVLTCQDYKGQTVISVHKDQKPQLLIKNYSDLAITVAQIMNKDSHTSDSDNQEALSSKQISKECQHFDWKCLVKPGEFVYYNMPSFSEKFPTILTEESLHSLPKSSSISFSSFCEDSLVHSEWTAPIDISTNINEQFVKLPNINKDVKVTVECHSHTTIVAINNVTQLDISASVIRQRLSENIPLEKDKSSALQESRSIASAKGTLSSISECEISKPQPNKLTSLSTVCSSPVVSRSKQNANCTLGIATNSNVQITLSVIFDHIIVVLRSGSLTAEKVGVLYLDYLAIDRKPTIEGSTITASVLEIQFDNALLSQGSYDFPVLIIRQNPISLYLPWTALWSIQNHQSILNQVRQSCLIKVTIHCDIWTPEENSVTAPRDVTIETDAISLYLEDTYISVILDYFSDMIVYNYPTMASDHPKDWTIKIPLAIIAEASSIANPLMLKNMTIKPVSLSLSMHTSVRLYLALDHSPLNFETFQRQHLMTSSYRLGHDLVMHYLSGAIIGAGWVVGSLEILGSPGGFVRRVGSGLRDLVLEPWNGLAFGPQAFLAGAAYGSWSLARQLTQGAVQSVSMVCGSVARNLDLLSLDVEHVRRAGTERRRRPSGVVDALARGFTGLAISLLGAVGGIAHHPIVAPTEGSGTSMATGITRGLLGVVTKPLSATADLVALAGQGLLSQAGWDNQPQLRPLTTTNILEHCPCTSANARLKFFQFSPELEPLYACYSVNPSSMLVITQKWLLILENEKVRKSVDLASCFVHTNSGGNIIELEVKEATSSLSIVNKGKSSAAQDQGKELEENDVEMLSTIKERVARYIGGMDKSNFSLEVDFAGCSNDRITLQFENFQAGFFCDMLLFAKREYKQEGFTLL